MLLMRKKNKSLQLSGILVTILASSAVSFIGAIVALQGGDYWPWVWVMCTLYVVELVYSGIVAVLYYRSPEAQRRRDLKKRRSIARSAASPM